MTRIFSYLSVSLIGLIVVLVWYFFAGPNMDTLLTFERNYAAHNFAGILNILAHQDQAPLPQVFHYLMYAIGLKKLFFWELTCTIIIVISVLYLLHTDLNTDRFYLAASDRKKLIIYTVSAVAFLVSPSFSSTFNIVRYSIIAGMMWYAIWILEEKIEQTVPHHKRRYALLHGLILGFGFVVSYTWGVVLVATLFSLWLRRQLQEPIVRRAILHGSLVGLSVLLAWILYSWSTQFALVLLRTHSRATDIVRFIGELWYLLIEPFVGALLFPGIINFSALLLICGCMVGCIIVLLRQERRYIYPLLSHWLLPIPFFVLTGVVSGYAMIGPGLILLSCAIKGGLRLSASRQTIIAIFGLASLIGATAVNIHGYNTMSAYYTANKSRETVNIVLQQLQKENTSNSDTMIIFGDENILYVAKKYAPTGITFRYLASIHSNVPNSKAVFQAGFKQDPITNHVKRIITIYTGAPNDQHAQFGTIRNLLIPFGFQKVEGTKIIGRYSRWQTYFSHNNSQGQYVIQTWKR